MPSIVTILGTRGSIPVSGASFAQYGGATACVLVSLGNTAILLDGGTGLLHAKACLPADATEIPLLLSHPHADHLLGIPMSSLLADPTRRLHLYASERDGLDAAGQLSRLMMPPLWPVSPADVVSPPVFHAMRPTFSFGDVTVETMEAPDGCHPGGVTLFRLIGQGKSVVYCTDCTLTEDAIDAIASFAADCDLLLCDGQYSPAEWTHYAAYGHNTWEAAARFGARCSAKQMRVIHHAPTRTDAVLDAASSALRALHPNCTFAYEGEEVLL